MTGNLWLSTGLDPIHPNSGEALFGLSLEATSEVWNVNHAIEQQISVMRCLFEDYMFMVDHETF